MNNLLKDKSYKAPKISAKFALYFVVIMIGILFVAQLIERKFGGGTKSAREEEYADNMRIPATASDSLLIDSMYTQLNRIYDRINAFNFDTIMEFGSKPALPAGFQAKLITYDLLNFMFDTLNQRTNGEPFTAEPGYYSFFDDVLATMGNGNFAYDFSTRKFQKGFAGDARHILSDKYVIVLVTLALEPPEYREGLKEFYTGHYDGALMLFDVSTGQLTAYSRIMATNSAEVKSIPYKKDGMNEELMKNLEKNIVLQVNYFSEKYLAQKVWPH